MHQVNHYYPLLLGFSFYTKSQALSDYRVNACISFYPQKVIQPFNVVSSLNYLYFNTHIMKKESGIKRYFTVFTLNKASMVKNFPLP